MHIIDNFIMGKRKDYAACEDGISIAQNMMAVIEGVIPKTDTLSDGKKVENYLCFPVLK